MIPTVGGDHMPIRTEYSPGTFCWVDLVTSNGAAARAFYGELFRWSMEDVNDGFTVFRHNGKRVAGIRQLTDTQRGESVASHWRSYVSVAALEQTLDRVKGLGGEVLIEPTAVADLGRMSVFRDPQGAVLGLWEPKSMAGAQLVNDVCSFCWNELLTLTPEESEAFHGKVFSWEYEPKSMPDGSSYRNIMVGGAVNGGCFLMSEEMGDMTPHWTVYFMVEDCAIAVERARKLGAQLIVGPKGIPAGTFAVLADPQGATFSVIAVSKEDAPS